MMDWLVSLIPWWVWLCLAAAVVGVVWRVAGWQGALAAVAGLLAVLTYGKGRTDAYRDERAALDRRNAQAMKDREDVDDEIADLGSNDVDERFARWMRDDNPG